MRSHKTTVFADDFWLLEGPRWHEGRLWVSDLLDGKVYSLDADGKRTLVCEVPNRPSGLGFMPDGALIIASMQDRKVLKHANGVTTVLADLWEHATGDVNDLLVDERGYTYVGNFGYDLHNGAPSTPTNMHVVSPDGAVRVAASGLEFPNGTVIADGGRTLIVAETWAGRRRPSTAMKRDACPIAEYSRRSATANPTGSAWTAKARFGLPVTTRAKSFAFAKAAKSRTGSNAASIRWRARWAVRTGGPCSA